jgi:hypothetical protein
MALRSKVSRMRGFITLLAIISLLVNPVAAIAAQAHCARYVDAPAHTEMTAMTQGGGTVQADSCCDPGKGAHKHKSVECANACAVMGGLGSAVPRESVAFIAQQERSAPPAARSAAVPLDEPGRLERPPRSTGS